MNDEHEQEKMDLSQMLIQQGRHEDVEESLKELQKRQQEQLDNKQAELDAELKSAESKIYQMINGETVALTTKSHRDILEEVSLLTIQN